MFTAFQDEVSTSGSQQGDEGLDMEPNSIIMNLLNLSPSTKKRQQAYLETVAYDATPVDPRNVVNAIIQRLREGDKIHFEALKKAFDSVAFYPPDMHTLHVRATEFVKAMVEFFDEVLAGKLGYVPTAAVAEDGDFLSRHDTDAAEGFEALYRAVDVNSADIITWDALLSVIMDASTLAIGGVDLLEKEYELFRTEGSSSLVGLSSVTYLRGRDQLFVVGKDVSMLANLPRYPLRSLVASCESAHNTTAFSASPFQVISATFVDVHNVVVYSCTDSMLRFVYVPLQHKLKPKHILAVRMEETQIALAWDETRGHLIVGSRSGGVQAFTISFKLNGNTTIRRVKSVQFHTESVTCIHIMQNDKYVVTTSFDGTMVMQDARTFNHVYTFRGHKSGVLKVIDSFDTNVLVSIGFELEPLVWSESLLTKPAFPLTDCSKPHAVGLADIALIPTTPWMVSMDVKGLVKVWDLQKFVCIQNLYLATQVADRGFRFVSVTALAVPPNAQNPNGTTQVLAFTRRRVYAMEYNRTNSGPRMTADDEPILFVAFNDIDGTYITATSTTVRVWDAATSGLRDVFAHRLHATAGGITSVGVNANYRVYYVGCRNGSVFGHNMVTGGLVVELVGIHPNVITTLLYCPVKQGADLLVTMSLELALITRQEHDEDLDATGFPVTGIEYPRCADFCIQSQTVVIGDGRGNIAFFAVDTLNPTRCVPQAVLQMPKPVSVDIMCLRVLRDLGMVVVADEDGHMAIFSLRHHVTPYKPIVNWVHGKSEFSAHMQSIPSVTTIAYYPRKKIVYCGDECGYVTAYDLREFVQKYGHRTRTKMSMIRALSPMATPAQQTITPRLMDMNPDLVKFTMPELFLSDASSGSRLGASNQSQSPSCNPSQQPTPRLETATGAPPVDDRSLMSVIHAANVVTRMKNRTPRGERAELPMPMLMGPATLVVQNQWRAHAEAVTSIAVRDDVGYANLITTSVDQTVVGWSMLGHKRLGCFDQHLHAHISPRNMHLTDDVPVSTGLESDEEVEESECTEAKRDRDELDSLIGSETDAGSRMEVSVHKYRTVPIPVTLSYDMPLDQHSSAHSRELTLPCTTHRSHAVKSSARLCSARTLTSASGRLVKGTGKKPGAPKAVPFIPELLPFVAPPLKVKTETTTEGDEDVSVIEKDFYPHGYTHTKRCITSRALMATFSEDKTRSHFVTADAPPDESESPRLHRIGSGGKLRMNEIISRSKPFPEPGNPERYVKQMPVTMSGTVAGLMLRRAHEIGVSSQTLLRPKPAQPGTHVFHNEDEEVLSTTASTHSPLSGSVFSRRTSTVFSPTGSPHGSETGSFRRDSHSRRGRRSSLLIPSNPRKHDPLETASMLKNCSGSSRASSVMSEQSRDFGVHVTNNSAEVPRGGLYSMRTMPAKQLPRVVGKPSAMSPHTNVVKRSVATTPTFSAHYKQSPHW